MQEVLSNFTQQILTSAWTLVGAGLVLFVGWLIAWIVSGVVRRLLHRTTLDNRIATWVAGEDEEGAAIPIERWVGRLVFWPIFLLRLGRVHRGTGPHGDYRTSQPTPDSAYRESSGLGCCY